MNTLRDRSPVSHRGRTSFFIDDILMNKPRKCATSPPREAPPKNLNDSRADSIRDSSNERFNPVSATAMLYSFPSAVRTSPGAPCSPPSLHVPISAAMSPHLVNSVSPMLAAAVGTHGVMSPEFAASYGAYLPGSYLGHQTFAHPAFQAAATAAAAAMSYPKHLDHPFLIPSSHGKSICS